MAVESVEKAGQGDRPEDSRLFDAFVAEGLDRGPTTWDDVKKIRAISAHIRRPFRRSNPQAVQAGKERARERRELEGVEDRHRDELRKNRARSIAAGHARNPERAPIGQCAWCGYLLLTRRRVEMHQACSFEARRTPEAQAWVEQRRRLRREGWNLRQLNPALSWRLPLPAGRRRPRGSPEVLTKHFSWAIRRLLGGEPVGALAKEAWVTRQAVKKAVERVLSLLPPDDIGDRRMQWWASELRSAAAEVKVLELSGR